jgi:ABC-2 type transport system ATP-binding protein
MSKGMKQKTAIIASFIKNKDILIFDEPTTGLDPLMRDAFVNLLLEQKALGKTIIFSTHIFLEAERVCNNVIFLNEGKIIDRVALNSIRFSDTKKYRIGFAKTEDVDSFVKTAKKLLINATKDAHSIQVIVQIANKNINQFMNILQNFSIKFITEIKPTLHAHFLKMLKNTTHSVV